MDTVSESNKTPQILGLVALALFVAATVWINYEVKVNVQQGRSGATVHEMGNVKLGQSAPDFSVKDLAGKEVTLASYRGQKVVLLDFWATWCAPCRMEMVELQTLLDKFKDKGLEILSVNQGETADQVGPFIKRKQYGFHVVLDADTSVAAKYGVRAIPTLVLIDKKGVIQWLQVGYSQNSGDLENAIAAALK